MSLKKIIPLVLLLSSFSFYAQSSSSKSKKAQIQSMKVAFITSEPNLSTKEAQRFWPVYNSFDDKQYEIRHDKMTLCKVQLTDAAISNLSDKEAAPLLDKMENYEDDLYALRKKYSKDLREILSPTKILLLRKAEDDFNRKLLHQYRDRAKKK